MSPITFALPTSGRVWGVRTNFILTGPCRTRSAIKSASSAVTAPAGIFGRIICVIPSVQYVAADNRLHPLNESSTQQRLVAQPSLGHRLYTQLPLRMLRPPRPSAAICLSNGLMKSTILPATFSRGSDLSSSKFLTTITSASIPSAGVATLSPSAHKTNFLRGVRCLSGKLNERCCFFHRAPNAVPSLFRAALRSRLPSIHWRRTSTALPPARIRSIAGPMLFDRCATCR